MRNRMVLFVLLPIIALLALPFTALGQEASPQQGRYFTETSQVVAPPFLNAWENTPNALFVLGYPISQPFLEESFTNPGQQYRVQYFERAVLEEHPENFGAQENRYYILGRLLGSELAQGRENEPPFLPVGDPGDGTWIAETQHTLRDQPAPFRSFWQNNGGLEVFGYPLSEQFQEVNEADGQTYWVQYFERQRMEWHPDNAEAPIQLGLLGNEYSARNHQNNPAFAPINPDAPPADTAFKYGYNAHLFGQDQGWQDRQRALALARESGVYWIRQQIRWEHHELLPGRYVWGEIDALVEDVHNADMRLLLSVVNSPAWATPDGSNGLPSRDNFDEFAAFMGTMAARYKGKVHAYQVWNEQNLAHENGGQVANADHYVDLLAVTYDAIKASDPDAIVVSGGPSSTETNDPFIAVSDVDFARQMFNNPNFRADVVGVHPGGQYNPPDTMWPEAPGPGPHWQQSREFYFRRVEDIRQVMVETGMGDKQIWLTEFGWATENNSPGYEYGNSNSYEDQAQYIVRAFEKGRYEYAPWMGAMFLWNLNFSIGWTHAGGNPMHEQASFSVLNGDWTPRPSWYAIRDISK